MRVEERALISIAKNLLASPRMRHSVIALTLAVVVALLTLMRPLDIGFCAIQSKLPGREPGGSIALVTDTRGVATNSIPAANRLLVSALEILEEQPVERIVIDTPLRESNDQAIDARLRRAIARGNGRVILSAPIDPDAYVSGLRRPNAPMFKDVATTVSSDLETDFLDFVWGVEPAYWAEAAKYPALWTVLAGPEHAYRSVQPDYTYSASDLPTVEISDLAAGLPEALEVLRGKQVVIASLGGDDRVLQAPTGRSHDVTSAHVHIVAAETALSGGGRFFSHFVTIPLFGLALLLIAALPLRRGWRRAAYAGWSIGFFAVFALAAWFGHRVMLAEPLVIAIAFGIQRGIANYRRRHLFVDAQSRLPNFTAFRRFVDAQGSINDHVLVVVKVARLDAIFATLKGEEQGEYLRQVAARLSLGETGENVYHDGGKYLGMMFRRFDYPDLQSHLEGLRAIASQAVMVGGVPIDVAITIGVDQSNEGDATNRISSAIAAADQAREAYRPVFIISDFQTDSEEWDHSLQSRLESALSENRISVKLQPKVDMQSGMFVGAEALARWTDQQRGEILPVRFILQCERAGRLDDLTKRVMEKSMQASITLAEQKLPSKVSVNVSAIQFVDSRVVDLVEMALSATGADPANIMIEITETARVENLVRARSIMEEIKRMGITFSIDDFGVGSGNLDALYGLPFDELKIDRMFSNEVGRCSRARAVVASLLELSRSFELRSVVEGIDGLDTFETLRDMGGDLAQGYCIARPQTLPLLVETLKLQTTVQMRRTS